MICADEDAIKHRLRSFCPIATAPADVGITPNDTVVWSKWLEKHMHLFMKLSYGTFGTSLNEAYDLFVLSCHCLRLFLRP
jgi:hypothetical protein